MKWLCLLNTVGKHEKMHFLHLFPLIYAAIGAFHQFCSLPFYINNFEIPRNYEKGFEHMSQDTWESVTNDETSFLDRRKKFFVGFRTIREYNWVTHDYDFIISNFYSSRCTFTGFHLLLFIFHFLGPADVFVYALHCRSHWTCPIQVWVR